MTLKATDGNIQTHISLYQNLIGRMSTLSGGVKMLGATVVGLVAVLGSGNLAQAMALSGFIFTIGILDAYYLAKERTFRGVYKRFVQDLHDSKDVANQLFIVKKPTIKTLGLAKAFSSPSVWVFYLALIGLTIAVELLRAC